MNNRPAASQTSKRAAALSRTKSSFLQMTLSELFWLMVFNLTAFGPAIQDATGFSYIDEFATLLLLFAAFNAKLKQTTGASRLGFKMQNTAPAIVLLFFVVVLGILGNAVYKVQDDAIPIAIDAFTTIKFPIALLAAMKVFRNKPQLFRIIEEEARILILLTSLLGFLNIFFDFGMGLEQPRFGFRSSFDFVFSHPTYLVFFAVGLNVILLSHPNNNRVWIVVSYIVIALSLRSKGIAFIAAAIVLILVMGRRQRLRVWQIIVAAIVTIAVGWSQFLDYFGTEGYARNELLRNSLRIAKEYYPLGTGFATFGSAITATQEYYSELYYKYGLSAIWGLEPGHAIFVSDTFWPTVLGQFGWLGLFFYIGSMICLFLYVYRLGGQRLATCCCFAYLLISSTSESAFFNPQAVYLAVCLAISMFINDTSGEITDESVSRSSTKNMNTNLP